MKKFIVACIVLVSVTGFFNAVSAQSILERAAQRARDRIVNRTEQKIDEAIDNTIDKGFDAVEDAVKGNNDSDRTDSRSKVDADVANPGEEKQLESVDAASVKNDFVRGDVIMFEDNLENEQMGEFPSKWDLISNNAEVARLNGRMAIKFEHGSDTKITPLLENGNKKYLPEVFTLEFDYFITGQDDHVSRYYIDFLADENSSDGYWSINFGNGDLGYVVSKPNSDDFVEGGTSLEGNHKLNGWNHFALSFNKRALKVYINGVRVMNIPNANKPQWFTINTEFWEDHIDYITAIRLAKGGVELYGRNATDMSVVEKAIAETGKFVTNNILFETGKATLKPESMAEIEKVAEYMKKNPSIRFEVRGHTDNQGSDAVNDPLSQQRAEAVVQALAGLGVDDFNLKAVGKGSHEPVADNSTEDGRAKNRRVEFVKH